MLGNKFSNSLALKYNYILEWSGNLPQKIFFLGTTFNSRDLIGMGYDLGVRIFVFKLPR